MNRDIQGKTENWKPENDVLDCILIALGCVVGMGEKFHTKEPNTNVTYTDTQLNAINRIHKLFNDKPVIIWYDS